MNLVQAAAVSKTGREIAIGSSSFAKGSLAFSIMSGMIMAVKLPSENSTGLFSFAMPTRTSALQASVTRFRKVAESQAFASCPLAVPIKTLRAWPEDVSAEAIFTEPFAA